MKKILTIIGSTLLVLLILLVLFLGNIVKGTLETFGPKLVGVPIQVEKVRVNPFTGVAHVKALSIGNPEGFHTPSMIEMDELKVVLSLPSLFTDTIVIKQILIEEPRVTYERSLTSSNINELQKKLAKKEDKEPGKKVIVEDFQFNRAKVSVSLTALKGKKLTVPLPSIHLKDIGKESDGVSPVEFTKNAFGAVTKTVTDVVTSAVDFTGNTLKSISSGAANAAGGVIEGVGGAVKGLFGED